MTSWKHLLLNFSILKTERLEDLQTILMMVYSPCCGIGFNFKRLVPQGSYFCQPKIRIFKNDLNICNLKTALFKQRTAFLVENGTDLCSNYFRNQRKFLNIFSNLFICFFLSQVSLNRYNSIY